MNKPVIIINFKTYAQSVGDNALRLAKLCEKVAFETSSDIRVAVPATDIYRISQEVGIPVYAEHADPYPLDRHTGAVVPEMLKGAGASGTLINHSEHQLPENQIKEAVEMCAKTGLVSVVCAGSPEQAGRLAGFKPDFIAVEPPELIAGDKSVSTAQPELITKSLELVKPYARLLVGAGIKSGQDVEKALELGADGVLIASGIDKAEHPEQALKSLVQKE